MLAAMIALVYVLWGIWLLWELGVGMGLLAPASWSMWAGGGLLVVTAGLAGITRDAREAGAQPLLTRPNPIGDTEPSDSSHSRQAPTVTATSPWARRGWS